MDNCNIFDFHIENDSDNRLKNFVKDAIESQEERIIIADKINNGKLQQWAINHKVIKEASEIWTLNGNTFKKLVVDYINAIRPSVTRSTMRRQNQSIGNFTSNQARTDALTYTGNLIRKAFYQASYSKDESLRKKDKSKVLNDIRNEIINNFFERAKIFLKENVNNPEVKPIIAQLKEIGTEIKSIKESNIPNQRKTQKINDLQKKRFELLYDTIIKVNKGNIAFTNYAELTKNVYDVNSFNQWFTEVKSLTSMFTITKEFDGDVYKSQCGINAFSELLMRIIKNNKDIELMEQEISLFWAIQTIYCVKNYKSLELLRNRMVLRILKPTNFIYILRSISKEFRKI